MDYHDAPATKLMKVTCAICGEALLDAKSVEYGMGPHCRSKHGFLGKNAPQVSEEDRKKANRLVYSIASGLTGVWLIDAIRAARAGFLPPGGGLGRSQDHGPGGRARYLHPDRSLPLQRSRGGSYSLRTRAQVESRRQGMVDPCHPSQPSCLVDGAQEALSRRDHQDGNGIENDPHRLTAETKPT